MKACAYSVMCGKVFYCLATTDHQGEIKDSEVKPLKLIAYFGLPNSGFTRFVHCVKFNII